MARKRYLKLFKIGGVEFKIEVGGSHDNYVKAVRYFLEGDLPWRAAEKAGVHHVTLKRVLKENNLIEPVIPPKKDEKFNDWGDWVYPPPRPWD